MQRSEKGLKLEALDIAIVIPRAVSEYRAAEQKYSEEGGRAHIALRLRVSEKTRKALVSWRSRLEDRLRRYAVRHPYCRGIYFVPLEKLSEVEEELKRLEEEYREITKNEGGYWDFRWDVIIWGVTDQIKQAAEELLRDALIKEIEETLEILRHDEEGERKIGAKVAGRILRKLESFGIYADNSTRARLAAVRAALRAKLGELDESINELKLACEQLRDQILAQGATPEVLKALGEVTSRVTKMDVEFGVLSKSKELAEVYEDLKAIAPQALNPQNSKELEVSA